MPRIVRCVKLGHEAEGLARPPYPGPLGQRIFENISRQAWQDWLAHQTRLINEYHLSMADPSARQFLNEEMERYFFGNESLTPTHYSPPGH